MLSVPRMWVARSSWGGILLLAPFSRQWHTALVSTPPNGFWSPFKKRVRRKVDRMLSVGGKAGDEQVPSLGWTARSSSARQHRSRETNECQELNCQVCILPVFLKQSSDQPSLLRECSVMALLYSYL